MTYRRRSNATMLAVTAALLVGCAPGSDLKPLPDSPAGPYQLGVGEQVRIITFGAEQLTGEFRVNDRGAIAIPLLGAVPATGATTEELERRIAAELKGREVLNAPSVSVEVLNYRPVFILGEVSRPGQYPYQPGMTVLTAVAVSGGFTYRAQTGYASVLRKVDGRASEWRVMRSTEIRPGDVINVFERYF